MIELVYVSRAQKQFSTEALKDMLRVFRKTTMRSALPDCSYMTATAHLFKP
jgi:hypothetical protein